MRYWQHNETGRLLKIDVQMAPRNWTELTKEQYEEAIDVTKTIYPASKERVEENANRISEKTP